MIEKYGRSPFNQIVVDKPRADIERARRISREWEKQYPINTFSGETKRELKEFFSQKEQEKVERIQEQVQKDLDSGKFYRICSNESTFKEYIFNLIED